MPITTNENYSPPPVGGVVRSISIVPPENCAGVAGAVDVIEDVVANVAKDAVEDAIDDAVVDVVDVQEVVVVVEGNVADAVDDGISEEEDDGVDVVVVEVIVACVDAGATHVLVHDDAV